MSATHPRPRPTPWALRWRSAQTIARQEFRDALLGWGIYLTAAIALLIAVLLVYNSVRLAFTSGLEIISRPFFTPALAAMTLVLVFITVNATLAIARPREQGALQLLFFAPVDAASLVMAHLLTALGVYLLLVLLLAPILALLAFLTNIALPSSLLWALLPALLVGGVAAAFGLALSAVAPSSRSAVLILVSVILLLLALPAAHAALLNIPPTSRYYDALLFVRSFLRVANGLLTWASPFALLNEGLAASLRADAGALAAMLLRATGGIVLWLLVAVFGLERRGVLP